MYPFLFLQRDERVLVVWCDDLEQIVPLCKDFNEKLMKLVWRSRIGNAPASIITSRTSLTIPSIASEPNLNDKGVIPTVGAPVQQDPPKEASSSESATSPRRWWSWRLSSKDKVARPSPAVNDTEKGKEVRPTPRPVRLLAPLYAGLGFGLAVCKYSKNLPLYSDIHLDRLRRQRVRNHPTRVSPGPQLLPFCATCDLALPDLCILGTFLPIRRAGLNSRRAQFFALQIVANLSFWCVSEPFSANETSEPNDIHLVASDRSLSTTKIRVSTPPSSLNQAPKWTRSCRTSR